MRQFVICHVSWLLPDNLELGIRQNSKQLSNFLILGFSTEKHNSERPTQQSKYPTVGRSSSTTMEIAKMSLSLNLMHCHIEISSSI